MYGLKLSLEKRKTKYPKQTKNNEAGGRVAPSAGRSRGAIQGLIEIDDGEKKLFSLLIWRI